MLMKHALVPCSVAALLALGRPETGLILADIDETIRAHRARQAEIADGIQIIQAQAEAENNRDLTTEELRQVNAFADEADGIERQIEAHGRSLALRNRLEPVGNGRQTEAEDTDAPQDTSRRPANSAPPANGQPRVEPRARTTPNGTQGFRNFGEFANAVRMGSVRGGDLDARLRNAAPTTYGNEGTGADGGFAVPPDYRSEILTKMFNEDSLLQRTDRLQSSSNTLTIPTDETTPWQTTGGIQAYWTAEGGTKTQSKPALGETTVKLHTLAVLVPVTEELLEDAPAMGAYLSRKAPEKMDFKVSDAIVRGTGVGQPLGFLNSPALVTVSKESAQTADTVNVTNLAKMWGRLPVQSRRTSVWLMHPDAEAQLPLMTLANQPVYLPPGGVNGNMYGNLWGRPVIPHQVAETIGDLGDVMLVDLSQYLTVTKTGNGRDANGMRQDVSIHLWFDQDMVAYRFTMRVAGTPWWAGAITQRDGSNTQSPYIVLEAR
jgi:HK97 family phage major capsid protein